MREHGYEGDGFNHEVIAAIFTPAEDYLDSMGTQADPVKQLVSEMEAAVMAPVDLRITFTRHERTGGQEITEAHRIEGLKDALCVILLALQGYGFDVDTLTALSTDDIGQMVDTTDAEAFLDGPSYS